MITKSLIRLANHGPTKGGVDAPLTAGDFWQRREGEDMRALVRVHLAQLPESRTKQRLRHRGRFVAWANRRIPEGAGSRIPCEEGGGAMNPSSAKTYPDNRPKTPDRLCH